MTELNSKDKFVTLEKRLERIEQLLKIRPKHQPTPPEETDREISTPVNAPQAIQGNWLGIIATICFILASGFIIKLSIDSGWLTQERQLGIVTLFGILLIGSGLFLQRSDKKYASFLPAAGIVVFYIASFAAHRYYQLISFEEAILCIGFISILCIFLYFKIEHDIYLLTATVGAYISPVILGFNAKATFSIYYFLGCSISFAIISIFVKSRLLTIISAYLAILMTALVGFSLYQDLFVALMLAAQFLIFTLGSYLYSKKTNNSLTYSESVAFLPVLLLFYAAEYNLIDQLYSSLAPWISIGFSAILFIFYFSAKRFFRDTLASQFLVFSFAAVIFFHSVYIELLPNNIKPWLFTLIVAIAAFIPSTTKKKNSLVKGALLIPALAVLSILGIEYLRMLYNLYMDFNLSWILVSISSFACLWIFIVNKKNEVESQSQYGYSLLTMAHLLAIFGLFRLTTDIGSLAVSASWLLYAILVIAYAFFSKNKLIARSSLFVLSFPAGKVLIYDTVSAPTIVRILCLLLTGVILYTSGLFLRKIKNWEK